ncbi:MAG: TadE/TadG family type IV pilus assembly protein [Deltaproteobacteria bacterium]
MTGTLEHRLGKGDHGTAIVEFLVSLVFLLPVLLYSVYLQDALYARLKTQEATAAAAWDFTGHLLHDYDSFNHGSRYGVASSAVKASITQAYGSLDPWSERTGGPTTGWLAGAGARARLTSVSCQASSGGSLDVGQAAAASAQLHAGGLVQCQAQAQVQNRYLDSPTHQGEVLNRFQIWPSDLLGSISVCGVGTAASGKCGATSAFTIFTDDWGLGQDGASDPVTNWPEQAQNKHFNTLSKVVHDTLPSPPWIPFDPLVDGPELDGEFGSSELTYHAHTPLDVGSPTANTEAGRQQFNTWPSDHGPFDGVATDAYQRAATIRVNRYLGR